MSSLDLIARYLAERARLSVFVPLAVLLAVAGRVLGSRNISLASVIDATVQAFVLVLAFRVWDDLEDRTRDAREHPRRVMVMSRRTGPFLGLLVILAVAGIAQTFLATQPALGLAALGIATAVLLTWYRLRRDGAGVLIGGQIVLLKYPAIAFAVAPESPSPVALVALYLVISAYEVFDDPALRASLASLIGKRFS